MPPHEPGIQPVKLFISYAHRDEELRQELNDHLSTLQRQGLIASWHDRQIVPGQEWAGAIDDALNQARVILLLISARFLASDYCHNTEMLRALERHTAGEAVVIPIILSDFDWQSASFSQLQALPKDAKPIKSWPDRDEAWTNVVRGIRRVIETLSRNSTPAAPQPSTAPVQSAGSRNVTLGGATHGSIIVTGDGNAITVNPPTTANPPVATAPVYDPSPELDFRSRNRLVTALLACDCLKTPQSRDQVIATLPAEISQRINRFPGAQQDVLSIVTTCQQFVTGLPTLLEIVESFDGAMLPWQQVQVVLREVLPALASK